MLWGYTVSEALEENLGHTFFILVLLKHSLTCRQISTVSASVVINYSPYVPCVSVCLYVYPLLMKTWIRAHPNRVWNGLILITTHRSCLHINHIHRCWGVRPQHIILKDTTHHSSLFPKSNEVLMSVNHFSQGLRTIQTRSFSSGLSIGGGSWGKSVAAIMRPNSF
jgi:hypothetical protein